MSAARPPSSFIVPRSSFPYVYVQSVVEPSSRVAGRHLPAAAGPDLQEIRDVVRRLVEVPAPEAPLPQGPGAELRLLPEVLLLPAVRPARRRGVRPDLRHGYHQRDVLLPRAGAAHGLRG